jgi:hypothetical protein
MVMPDPESSTKLPVTILAGNDFGLWVGLCTTFFGRSNVDNRQKGGTQIKRSYSPAATIPMRKPTFWLLERCAIP